MNFPFVKFNKVFYFDLGKFHLISNLFQPKDHRDKCLEKILVKF